MSNSYISRLIRKRQYNPVHPHCGPGNIPDEKSPSNPIDRVCWQHDRDPNFKYLKSNVADDKFISRMRKRGMAGKVYGLPFSIKRLFTSYDNGGEIDFLKKQKMDTVISKRKRRLNMPGYRKRSRSRRWGKRSFKSKLPRYNNISYGTVKDMVTYQFSKKLTSSAGTERGINGYIIGCFSLNDYHTLKTVVTKAYTTFNLTSSPDNNPSIYLKDIYGTAHFSNTLASAVKLSFVELTFKNDLPLFASSYSSKTQHVAMGNLFGELATHGNPTLPDNPAVGWDWGTVNGSTTVAQNPPFIEYTLGQKIPWKAITSHYVTYKKVGSVVLSPGGVHTQTMHAPSVKWDTGLMGLYASTPDTANQAKPVAYRGKTKILLAYVSAVQNSIDTNAAGAPASVGALFQQGTVDVRYNLTKSAVAVFGNSAEQTAAIIDNRTQTDNAFTEGVRADGAEDLIDPSA